MSKRTDTVWEAAPHTVAKITMLGHYLFVWFSVLGTTFRGRDLWYIDGFAGPGEYTNFSSGSPRAAIKAAEAALQNPQWKAGKIRCFFIEENKARFAHLSQLVAGLTIDKRVTVQIFLGTFVEGIEWLKSQTVNPFASDNPVFSFIDPFGTRGLWFEAVSDLLSRPSCEVLINFDSDGVSRVLKAGEDANHVENLNRLFGTSTWQEELDVGLGLTMLSRKAVDFYLRLLRDLPKVDYAFPFEMTSKKGLVNYHLVFASQHPKGLQKMKESMRKIDQSGEFTFCDAHVGQQNLFSTDNMSFYARQLSEKFRGRTVSYPEIERFALNESPFLNCKAMLRTLEESGMIEVTCNKPRRRVGTFPDGSSISVRFIGGGA